MRQSVDPKTLVKLTKLIFNLSVTIFSVIRPISNVDIALCCNIYAFAWPHVVKRVSFVNTTICP
jgi:hypothetical protein